MESRTIICLGALLLVSSFLFAKKVGNGTKTGKASYYAKKFHNKRTANGLLYDPNAYTCAHKEFPFGTKLLVKNPTNNKEVVVEVTDRGPFTRGRIVDLSWAAAKDLDIVTIGVATVEVSQYIEPPKMKLDIPRLEIEKTLLLPVIRQCHILAE